MHEPTLDKNKIKKKYWNENNNNKMKQWEEELSKNYKMPIFLCEVAKILEVNNFCFNHNSKKEEVIKKLICADKKEMEKLNEGIKYNREEKIYITEFIELKDSNDSIKLFFLDQYEKLQSRNFITDNIRNSFTVCPYCNATYLFDLKQRKMRGGEFDNDYFADQLDHYYPKSRCPYLAVSIFNLVPSCPTCNLIKGSKEEHLYPYAEEMGENAKFELTPKCLGELRGIKFEVDKELDKRVELKVSDTLHNVNDDEKEEYLKRLEGSKEIFQLENKYSNATHEIEDLYLKHLLYSRKGELMKYFGNELGLSEERMKEIYFGTTEREKEHRRPLSKFTNDIIDFLGD